MLLLLLLLLLEQHHGLQKKKKKKKKKSCFFIPKIKKTFKQPVFDFSISEGFPNQILDNIYR